MIAIARRAFINYIRNRRNLVIMILFPIILMTILGAILKSAFTSSGFNNVNVYYYSHNPSKENAAIVKTLNDIKDNKTINFKATTSLEAGKNIVKNNEDSFVYINGNDIEIFNSVEKPVAASVVNSYVSSIVKRFNAIDEAMKVNPIVTMESLKANYNNNSVMVEKLPAQKTPGSFDYYAITELTLFALYAAITPLVAMDYDERRNIKSRIKLAGISDLEYQLGNTLGYFFVSIVITLPAFLYAMFSLKVDVGNPFITYGSVLLLAVTSVLLGQVIAGTTKNSGKAITLLKSLIFPILGFLGGAYTPIYSSVGTVSKGFSYLTQVSPLRWINKGLLDYIYQGTYRSITISTVLDLGFIILFILILIELSKKEER